MRAAHAWPEELKKASAAWVMAQAPVIIYMLKLTVAVLLALGLSLRFDLSKPSTAMLTVIIVMQPRSALVLAKSFYRFLGTVAGVMLSLLLVACFSQEPTLFLLAGACWLALCTAGSTVFRNFQSYGFVLAGYTLVIVGLPAALQPDQAFDIAVTRLSEVMLGLLCAGVVSDVVFPQRLSDSLLAAVRRRYADFAQYIRRDAAHAASGERTMLRFIGEVISLEALRSSSVFENPGHRLQSTQLRRLNTAFMTASTTFHSLDQLLMRLQNAGKQAALAALLRQYRAITDALQVDAAAAAQQLRALRLRLPAQLANTRSAVLAAAGDKVDSQALLDFDSASELLLRFADELLAYTLTHAALLGDGDTSLADDTTLPAHYVPRTDPLMVLFAGLRTATAFGLSMLFWILSGWPSGVEAVVLATVVSSLFAAAPFPSRTVRHFIIGAAGGGLAAFIFAYGLQPHAENFVMLCLALAPFLLLAAWLAMQPKYAGIGTGMLFFTLNYGALDSAYSFDALSFFNGLIAGLIGVGIASVMYVAIDPADSRWVKRRLAGALRRQVVLACRQPLAGLMPAFESATRDLLQRFAVSHELDNEDDREVLAWLLSVLEIGRAVIHLRQDVQPAAAAAVERCVRSIASLFTKPHPARRQAAIDAALQAIAECQAMPALSANLHLIRSSLLDETSVLAALAVNSQTKDQYRAA
ncbi:FUSC family protein [Paraherbaspirillum soli]|uniref:FUSC family protein n=1 Tax=Paraherbaspirillum soli TaxID=631222 RepID=A0ABW0MC99_9BURK